LIRVDFPAPETPVTATISPSGMRTSMFCRLFSDAFFMVIQRLPLSSGDRLF